jgi:hypothetical protein
MARALTFYAKTRGLIREAAAEEGLPGDFARRPSRDAGRLAKLDQAAAKAAAERFVSSLAALVAAAKYRTAASKGADREAAALLYAEFSLPGATELALCYAVLDGLKPLCSVKAKLDEDASEGARRIVERYCLDRKLREALRAAGMHGDEAYRSINLAKVLLSKLGTEGRACPDPGVLVGEWSRDEELRGILGFNVFGDVTWFNKERFEEAARRSALYGYLGRADLESARCAVSLIAAAEKSGYSLEALTAELGPAVAAKEPVAKKAIGSRKKAPATKAKASAAKGKTASTRAKAKVKPAVKKTAAKAKAAPPKEKPATGKKPAAVGKKAAAKDKKGRA